MQMKFYFRDLGKTEAIEAYLNEKAAAVAENFFKYDPSAHLTVRVESDRHRTGGRKPAFVCEVLLKVGGQKTPFKVRKNAVDFYAAVNESMNALRNILGRRSARRSQHRRHEHSRELRDLIAS